MCPTVSVKKLIALDDDCRSCHSSPLLIAQSHIVEVLAVIAAIIFSSKMLDRAPSASPDISVRQLGDQLMSKYVLPLEVLALLLTAALIGAVILAMQESGPAQHGENK